MAFSSCYVPEAVHGANFWRHVREQDPDLWIWMGDNMYADGNDMNKKRLAYNVAREEPSYLQYGPVNPDNMIPVMATWDDHDFGFNNAGSDYTCLKESQAEFVHHFSLPESDPRHWNHPGGQQQGVYSARMFKKPDLVEDGLHVITLDARSGRDPTYQKSGTCKGEASKELVGKHVSKIISCKL